MKLSKQFFGMALFALIVTGCKSEEPIPTYSISVEVNDPLYGSAYIGDEEASAVVVEEGSNVTLHAVPTEEGVFDHWEISNNQVGSGTQTVTQNPYTLSGVAADYTALAVFERAIKYYDVTLTVEGSSYGSAYINTEGTTSLNIAEGGNVELHAVPTDGGHFVNWTFSQNGQEITSEENPLNIEDINENLNIKVVFEELPYTVSVSTATSEYGSTYINVAGNESAKVGENSTVKIYAQPSQSGYFYSWSYVIGRKVYTSVQNPLVLTDFTGDVMVTANFIDKDQVVFVDDFEQESSIPDPSKWMLCPRGTVDWNNTCSESYDLAYVEDGVLHLDGIKKGALYRTGAIQMVQSIGYEHVRVEVTAKFVTMGQGQWPAIWMMPRKPLLSGWPQCGEIDIMEHLNKDTFYYSTIHSYYANNVNGSNPKKSQTVSFDNTAWNTFGVEWNYDEMHFLLNGKVVFSYPNLHLSGANALNQWPFDTTFYLILDQQLGGSWVGSINDSQLPAIMEIDRVLITKLPE